MRDGERNNDSIYYLGVSEIILYVGFMSCIPGELDVILTIAKYKNETRVLGKTDCINFFVFTFGEQPPI